MVASILDQKLKSPGVLKHRNPALEKTRLAEELAIAQESKDEEKIKQALKKVEELDEYVSQVRRRQSSNKNANSIAALNNKNRDLTLVELDHATRVRSQP